MAHDLVLPGVLAVPATVAYAGEAAARRYVEFFAAGIRNPNTRAAYARAASDFFGWCGRHGLALAAVEPVHVAAWVEGLGRELSAPSVKQRLAAMRMLFDWLVVGQVVPHNPATPVRGPKHSAVKGKTRMPAREEAKALLAAIPTNGSGARLRCGVRNWRHSHARLLALPLRSQHNRARTILRAFLRSLVGFSSPKIGVSDDKTWLWFRQRHA